MARRSSVVKCSNSPELQTQSKEPDANGSARVASPQTVATARSTRAAHRFVKARLSALASKQVTSRPACASCNEIFPVPLPISRTRSPGCVCRTTVRPHSEKSLNRISSAWMCSSGGVMSTSFHCAPDRRDRFRPDHAIIRPSDAGWPSNDTLTLDTSSQSRRRRSLISVASGQRSHGGQIMRPQAPRCLSTITTQPPGAVTRSISETARIGATECSIASTVKTTSNAPSGCGMFSSVPSAVVMAAGTAPSSAGAGSTPK